MASVVSIHRVRKRDEVAEGLAEATFVTDFGLRDDWRSRARSTRRITLVEAEVLERVARTLGLPVVPSGASRRQVIVRGIDLNALVGRRVRVGPVLVAVEELCLPCRNMEVKIGAGAQAAMGDRGGVCGRVVEGGTMRPGDPVAVE